MDRQEFINIRKEMGLTQQELANVLATSVRAVQSYEQGWRNIVPAVERNLLLLWMSHRNLHKSKKSCWNLKKCPLGRKNRCLSWQLKQGQLCWFITGTLCSNQNTGNWARKMEICRQCEVFRFWFDLPGDANQADPPIPTPLKS